MSAIYVALHFLKGSPRWKELEKSSVKRLPDVDCTLKDWQSSEFKAIVDSALKKDQTHQKNQMMNLAELLDKDWDGLYAQRLETHVYDAKSDRFLEITVPSSFSKYLVQQAWLPSTLPIHSANSKVLYRGSELFNRASNRIKSLLHTHAPYLDASVQSNKLLAHLQVRNSITRDDLLQCLISWSTTAATRDSGKFRTSIDHMCGVYSFLLEDSGHDGSAIVDNFADESLVFVPNRYDEDTRTSDDVEGRFLSIHNVCWMDPASVLYVKQKYNRPLPDSLPRVLSLHYTDGRHQMQSIFQQVGINKTPVIRTYVVLLKYISSLSVEPEVEHMRDFTSIVTYLVRACADHREHLPYLTNNLKGVKVFPSHRHMWVSLSECLIENDDTKLAKTFGKVESVHFIQWPAKLVHRETLETQENREEFLRICSIPKLSEEVRTQIYHGGSSTPMEDLKAKISLWVPLIQKYLLSYCKDQYDRLLTNGIVEHLSRLQVFSTPELKCLYYIEHEGHNLESPDPAPRICALEIDASAIPTIYVAERKKDKTPTFLLEPLMKLFAHGVEEDEESEIRKFLSRLLSDLPESAEDVDELAQEYQLSPLSDSEEEWVVPLPRRPQVEEEEEEEESSSDEGSVEEGGESRERGVAGEVDGRDEDRPMTCWPPKAAIDPAPSSHKRRDAERSGAGANQSSVYAGSIGEEELREVRKKHSLESEQAPKLTETHRGNAPPRQGGPRDGAGGEQLPGREDGGGGQHGAGKGIGWLWRPAALKLRF